MNTIEFFDDGDLEFEELLSVANDESLRRLEEACFEDICPDRDHVFDIGDEGNVNESSWESALSETPARLQARQVEHESADPADPDWWDSLEHWARYDRLQRTCR